MDIKGKKEVVTVGKTSQPTEIRGICVLVVDDDFTCNNIVASMLQCCCFEAMHVGGFLDVFNVMCEIKDRLDHVVTNAHNLEPNGPLIVHHIVDKLNVHVSLMDHHGEKVKSNGKPFSFAAYVAYGLSINDVDRIWQYALVEEKAAAYQEQNAERASVPDLGVLRKNATLLSTGEPKFLSQTNKRSRETFGKSEEDKRGPCSVAKKSRVVWTAEMHQKFLEAIGIIGYEKAVPKKIVEVMGIPGLTRENIASHLQKFRGSLKRTQEAALNSLSSRSTATEYKGLLESNDTAAAGSWQSIFASDPDTFQNRLIPGLMLDPNFLAQGDHARNMVLSLSTDGNQPSSSKFVGYKLTSDGKSIEFGEPEASGNGKISKETQVSYLRNSVNQFTGNNSQQLSLLGISSGKTPFQCQSVLGINPIEVLSDEELFMAALETPGDELSGQNSKVAFFLDIPQPSSCPQIIQWLDAGTDDNLAGETGSTSVDAQDFNDNLFMLY